MISGIVTGRQEAEIGLTIFNSSGVPHRLTAVIDTGFNSQLTLPPQLIADLDLVFDGYRNAVLADGSVVALDRFGATVEWDGQMRRITILQSDGGPLVGMELLRGFRMTMDIIPGGSVVIEALAP